MESKKINQLATNLSPVTTDLTVIGDPTTGELKKITLLQIASLFGAGLTSVGMVVPSGFTVSPASLTSSGTFTIAGAGTTAQYLRGDGTLATFPSLTVYVPYTGASANVYLGTNNIYANAFYNGFTSVTASGTQVVLTVNSAPEILVNGSGGQTIKLPDATTLSSGTTYSVNDNQSSGAVSVNNNSNTLVVSIPSGGYAEVILIDNTTAAGSWDRHFQAPANVSWSTNTFDYGGSITSATWNGLTVQPNRGGTGQSTYTDGQLLIGNSTGNTLSKSTLTAGTGISITNGSGTITITNTSPSSGGTVTSVSALTLGTTGTDLSSSVATGTTTPVITLNVPTASASNRGALSSTDWSTFNGKQSAITLTVTGSSGAATFITNTLNIPTYTLAGLGGQASSTNLTSLSGLTYVSASFVKMTASGTFSLDTATYLTANQTITLSGDVSGSGTTAITTAIGTNKVTNAMLAQIATGTFHARLTAGTGNVETLTGTQATTLLDVFSSTLKGLAPASGGGTTNFLRADGTWAAPATGGTGTVTSVSVVSANGFAGTVATATTTPAITLTTSITGILKGNGTAISAATSGTDYQAPSTNLTSLSGLTFVSTSFVKMTAAGTFALDTTAYTANTGTVTSVAMTVPTGLSIAGTPITTSGTLALTFTAGYSIPTTTSQTNWDTAYTNRITSLTTTGSSGASTLTTNTLNIPNYTLTGLGGQPLATNLTSLAALTFASTSFVKMTAAGTFALDTTVYTANTGTVTSVAALTLGTSGTDLGSSVATGTTTPVITLNVPTASATNRGALSSADWTTFNGKESALTFSTPLSRATNTISIPASTTSVNGYLTSTDWTTFNNKFTLPSLTSGSVLFSNGTTIAQDNASFFWDDTNNRLGIGTNTPANNLDVVRGTAGTMARGFYESASVSYNADTKFGIYTASATATDGASLYLGQTNLLNASSQYGGFELQYRYNSSTTENLRINYVSRLATGAVSTSTSDLLLISKTGAATFLSSVTSTSFVKTSGTSAQILAADGSVITAGTNITISGATISSSNIYTTNGTLTSARTITAAGYGLTYSDNKNGQGAITISNTTAGTTSAAGLIMTSDASSGNGIVAKLSSTYTTSAIATSNDFTFINYTAGNIVILNTFATGLIKFGVGTSTSAQMTMTNDGHLLIGTTTNGTNFLDVNGNTNIAGTLYVTYPNSSRPSINFATSGTLRSLPLTGDMEMDGTGKLYFTHNDTERGVIPAYQFFKPTSAITLVSQTAAQPIFNSITNGAVTLKSSTNYIFEMLLSITNLSSTSGTLGFAIGGGATFTSIAWHSIASKVNNLANAASHQNTFNLTTSNAQLVTASAFTSAYVRVWGSVRINAGGTFIPQITLGVAAAATINTESYFTITALSASSVGYIGNWS